MGSLRDFQSSAIPSDILLALGRSDQAETTLRQALVIAPKEVWLHHTSAIALRRQGRFDTAVQEAELAVRLAPDEPEHRDPLARVTAPQNVGMPPA